MAKVFADLSSVQFHAYLPTSANSVDTVDAVDIWRMETADVDDEDDRIKSLQTISGDFWRLILKISSCEIERIESV